MIGTKSISIAAFEQEAKNGYGEEKPKRKRSKQEPLAYAFRPSVSKKETGGLSNNLGNNYLMAPTYPKHNQVSGGNRNAGYSHQMTDNKKLSAPGQYSKNDIFVAPPSPWMVQKSYN